MKKVEIPQAMWWKYKVKCSKNKDGDSIDIWESKDIPKPNRIQIIEILKEYKAYLKIEKKDMQEKQQAVLQKLGITKEEFLLLKVLT